MFVIRAVVVFGLEFKRSSMLVTITLFFHDFRNISVVWYVVQVGDPFSLNSPRRF